MGADEQILLERSKAGDIAAFEKLIENYQKKIFNLALRMIGDYDDASDLAQEALIRIYRSIPNFREQSSFSTWVYRITANVCLDEIRKRKTRKIMSLDEEIHSEDGDIQRQIASDDPPPDELMEREELKRLVSGAIAALPEDWRIVVTLRDIQGLTYDEIAKVLDCPTGTVKSRINRARRALKNVLLSKRELLNEEFVK